MKMHSPKTPKTKGVPRIHRWGTLAALTLAGFIYFAQTVTGHTQTPVPGNSSTAPASASTAERASEGGLAAEDRRHWEDFLKLADKPNGLVTLQDVEVAFGEKLIYGKPSYANFYELGTFLRYQEGVFPLYRAKHPKRKTSSVTLFLQDQNTKTCMTPSKIAGDLQHAGWKFGNSLAAFPGSGPPRGCHNGLCPTPLPSVPPTDYFKKGDQGILFVAYPTKCPGQVSMQTDRDN